MPVIHTHTNVNISDEQAARLKTIFGEAIATVPGKSEQWLMCVFDGDKPIYHGGTAEPAALLEVSVYARADYDESVWEALTEQLTDAVSDVLGIDPARIYVKEGASAHFGWNGSNF